MNGFIFCNQMSGITIQIYRFNQYRNNHGTLPCIENMDVFFLFEQKRTNENIQTHECGHTERSYEDDL
jgi:hypothetical protein